MNTIAPITRMSVNSGLELEKSSREAEMEIFGDGDGPFQGLYIFLYSFCLTVLVLACSSLVPPGS